MTQNEEAFVQYKSHQAHRGGSRKLREKGERTTEGFMKRKKEKELDTL